LRALDGSRVLRLKYARRVPMKFMAGRVSIVLMKFCEVRFHAI
jgi:hypothetical protein